MNGLNHINYLSPIAIGGPGTKLAKNAVGVGGIIQYTTDYCGSFVYEDGDLQYLLTSEGRVVFNPDGTHEYQYFLKDHLGNTRVTFGEDGIIQEDSYYPFGMTMAGLSHQTGEDLPNKHLYNGKELQDDYGLDWYDYGARFYDPVIGRWYVIDPLSETNYDLSPYNYVNNCPTLFIDPNGMNLDEYELNKNTGEMKNVGSSENDVVYAVSEKDDGSTERTGEKVEFDGKPITKVHNKGTSSEGKTIQSVYVNNTTDGETLFDFVKEQTGEDQEWSQIDYSLNGDGEDAKSIVSTGGLKGNEPEGSRLVSQLCNVDGAKIFRFDHNHPVDRDETDKGSYSSGRDRKLRDKVLSNNSDASVIIHWKKRRGSWLSRSIKNDTKHFYKGEF